MSLDPETEIIDTWNINNRINLFMLDAHESHHRGQITLALKQSGHTLDKKIAYGIWEWGVR